MRRPLINKKSRIATSPLKKSMLKLKASILVSSNSQERYTFMVKCLDN